MDDASTPRRGSRRREKTLYIEVPVILRIPITKTELGDDDPDEFAADLVRDQAATLGGVDVELSLQSHA
jgi:hypothetical protein